MKSKGQELLDNLVEATGGDSFIEPHPLVWVGNGYKNPLGILGVPAFSSLGIKGQPTQTTNLAVLEICIRFLQGSLPNLESYVNNP